MSIELHYKTITELADLLSEVDPIVWTGLGAS